MEVIQKGLIQNKEHLYAQLTYRLYQVALSIIPIYLVDYFAYIRNR